MHCLCKPLSFPTVEVDRDDKLPHLGKRKQSYNLFYIIVGYEQNEVSKTVAKNIQENHYQVICLTDIRKVEPIYVV